MSVALPLVADAGFGGFVPDALAAALVEDQAGVAQLGEVVAEVLLLDRKRNFVPFPISSSG